MRKIFAALLLPALLAIPAWAGATTYYVDCNADGDAGAGTSTAANVAWKTINKVNTSTFSAGDSILFNKGCTWRETLTVPSSGSAGNVITFGAYGTGAKPIISGANLVTPGTSWAADVDAEETGGLFASGIEDEADAFTTDFTNKSVGGSNTVVVSTAQKANGSKSGIVTYGGGNFTANAYKTIADQSDVYVRAYVYFDSSFTLGGNYSAAPIITIRDASGWNLATVYIKSVDEGGALNKCAWQAIINNPSTEFYNGTKGEISPNTWYRLELRWKADATIGGAQVWLDGVSLASNFTKDTSSYAADTIQIGGSSASYGTAPTAGSIMYFDNVKVDTSAIGAYSAGAIANVWNTTVTTEPLVVAFNGVRGVKESSKAACNATREWFWSGNTLSVYSTTDPDTAYVAPGIEPYARQYAGEIIGKSWVTIDGIEFVGGQPVGAVADARDYGAALSIEIPAADATYQGWTVQNCTFTHAGGQGLMAWMEWTGSPGNRVVQTLTISNNTFDEANWELSTTNNANLLFVYSRPSDVHFSGVTISGNSLYQDITINPTNDGGYFTGGMWLDTIGGATVESNEVEGTSHGITIYPYDNSDSIGTLRYNFIHDLSDDCIWLADSFDSGSIDYNVCSDTLDQGIDTYRAAAAAGQQSGVSIRNNTFVRTANAGVNLVKAASMVLRNNVFYECGTGGLLGQDRYAFSISDTVNGAANVSMPGLDSDYNVAFHSSGALWSVVNSVETEARALADWVSAKSLDSHSLASNPLFLSSSDFHLTSASPAINAGVSVGLTKDFSGRAINGLPDIGAYEYSWHYSPSVNIFPFGIVPSDKVNFIPPLVP